MDKKQEEKQEVTERIKTFEDAQRETGRPDVPEFNEAPEEMREFLKAIYQAAVITKALVGDWKPDWNDSSQRKWFPWFIMSSGGFVFDGAYCGSSDADAGYASRLCFPTEEMAEYAGRQFTDVYSRIILK
jgi:hypothetical protein